MEHRLRVLHRQKLAQRVLQYIALDRMDVVFATMLLKRMARYLIGHREIEINHLYRDNLSQFDCHTDADWAGNVTTRLSTKTAGVLMHGDHLAGGRSLMRKVRTVSSGESEFHGQGFGAAKGLLMKHMCHETGEPCWKMSSHRSEIREQ